MICSSCGSTIESFNRFCPKCGAPVQSQTPPPGGPGSYTPPPQQPMYSGPVAPPPPRKSSCGKIILILGIILILLLGGIAAAVYFGYGFVEKKLKSSEPYTLAIAALKENPEVRDKMGEIQETGFPIGAYSEDASGSGKAAFTMSVKGSLAKGQYQVSLERSNSKWRIENGFVRLENGEMIYVAGASDTDTSIDWDANDNSAPSPSLEQGSTSSGTTISGGVLNAKATSLPKPAYPPLAKQAGATGTVVVQVLVDERGNVVTANAVSGHPLLRPLAVAAARQAKFSPTKLSGKPVKVRGVIQYNFTPEGTE